MITVNYSHAVEEPDSHGRTRIYFLTATGAKIPIHGQFGSLEFNQRYRELAAAHGLSPDIEEVERKKRGQHRSAARHQKNRRAPTKPRDATLKPLGTSVVSHAASRAGNLT